MGHDLEQEHGFTSSLLIQTPRQPNQPQRPLPSLRVISLFPILSTVGPGAYIAVQSGTSTVYSATAKTQYRKFETNIPRKGIVRPQSKFPHSCVCTRFIYSHDLSDYFAVGKYVDRFWEYISLTGT
jgi:hypothetical protein